MTDRDTLLSPLTDTAPCGEDMTFSSEFDAIAEARRFDDPSLDQGEWVTDIKEADWRFVVRECEELLSNRTKDMRLVSWLTEGWAMTRGFDGLAEGFSVFGQLIDQFWDNIHPLPEDGDMEQRIGNLSWLITRSQQLLKEIPVTQSPRGVFSAATFESARALAAAMERNPSDASSLAEGKVTQQEFDAARRDTPRSFYTQTLESLAACENAFVSLEQAVDARLGLDGPSFSPLRDDLETVTDLVKRFARDAGVPDVGGVQKAAFAGSVGGVASGGAAPSAGETAHVPSSSGSYGPLNSRAQALAQLREVAEYFRRTEPHSPVAYLAEKAAKWGEMPLHDWLRAVVKEQGALAHVEELLGLDGGNSDD